MASKRRIRRKGCDGKKRYETRVQAVSASVGSARTFGGAFNAYSCQFCGGFHVGHIPGSVRRASEEPFGRKGRKG